MTQQEAIRKGSVSVFIVFAAAATIHNAQLYQRCTCGLKIYMSCLVVALSTMLL
jgi:hypothetical protein